MRVAGYSLVRRILFFHLITVAIAAIALPIGVSMLLHRTSNEVQDQFLTDTAAAVGQRIRLLPGGNWTIVPGGGPRGLDRDAANGISYLLVDAGGRSLSARRGDKGPDPRRLKLRAQQHFTSRTEGASVFRVGTFPVVRRDARAWLVVAQDSGAPEVLFDDVAGLFLARASLVFLPFLLLWSLATALIVRLSLRPVIGASQQARRISPRAMDTRLPEAGLPVEVLPLAHATNEALDRLETGFRDQRAFISNVAHEIRTPLAIMRLHVDQSADREAAALLLADIDRINHVASQLLDLALVEHHLPDLSERVELNALCRDVVAMMAPLAIGAGHGIALVATDEPVTIRGAQTLLTLALTNLIDNGVKHTPPSTNLTVTVLPEGGVAVSDDGPGLSEDQRRAATGRFWRGAGGGAGGAGLGLAIVAHILSLHEGRLEIGESETGGACFTLWLPAA